MAPTANRQPATMQALAQAAERLKTLAHPVRLRIIQLLLTGDFTVGELAEDCRISSPAASEHLRLMQHCGLLHSQRHGRKVYYRVAEPHLAELVACVERRFLQPSDATPKSKRRKDLP